MTHNTMVSTTVGAAHALNHGEPRAQPETDQPPSTQSRFRPKTPKKNFPGNQSSLNNSNPTTDSSTISSITIPSPSEEGGISSSRCIPTSWTHQVAALIAQGLETNRTYDQQTQVFDRFFVSGGHTGVPSSRPSWDTVFLVASVHQRWSFSDCYSIVRSNETAYKILNSPELDLKTNIMSALKFDHLGKEDADKYYQNLLPQLLPLVQWEATADHQRRLGEIALRTNADMEVVKAVDTDVWHRKKFSPDHPIRTPFGTYYVFFLWWEMEERCEGGWLNVGSSCPSCGKENPSLKCSGCKEARYCCSDHQRSDWKTHKLLCKK